MTALPQDKYKWTRQGANVKSGDHGNMIKYPGVHLDTVHSIDKVIVSKGRVQASPLVSIVTDNESETEDDESRAADNGNPKHNIFLCVGARLFSLDSVDIYLDTVGMWEVSGEWLLVSG